MDTYEIEFNDRDTITANRWRDVMNYVKYDDVRRIIVLRDGVVDYIINVHTA